MEHETSLASHRRATRRALLVSLLILGVVTLALVWNARRLEGVEARINEKTATLRSLQEQRTSLTDTLRSLQDAPEFGLRAVALPVPVKGEVHDFMIWVDTSDLSQGVREVRYEFEGSGYDPVTSTLADTGFAAYFRGPSRPDQPVCPGQTSVTITFEDASSKQIPYDLCHAVGTTVECSRATSETQREVVDRDAAQAYCDGLRFKIPLGSPSTEPGPEDSVYAATERLTETRQGITKPIWCQCKAVR